LKNLERLITATSQARF